MTDQSPVRLRPEIAALPAYQQGKLAGVGAHKLSSNENPFDPLPSVREALAAVPLNRYPDATVSRLRRALAARLGVDDVHVGAGSVSILIQLVQAVAIPGDEVVYAWPSFEGYPWLVTVTGATGRVVPLTGDGRHDLDAMAAAITDRTRAVIVCTPNNPTGPAISRAELDAFLDRVPPDVLVLLDEAYTEFVTRPDAVDGIAQRIFVQRPNVVVLRTFSKAYGLAGLRVGYAVGHPRILQAARSTNIPFSVTTQAEAAALASLAAQDELDRRVADIAARRDRLADALREAGWRVPEAQGNFVWLPVGQNAQAVAAAFEEAGVIVRAVPDHGVRITVGEPEAVEKVLRAAASVVEGLPREHPARALA